jgi:hypothetical protein
VATPPPPPAAPPPPVAKPTPEEMGYDPDTGQVLDAEKYKRWTKAQKDVKTETSSSVGETIYETFLRANNVLQEWIDDETNKTLLISGGNEAVKNDPVLRGLVLSFELHGKDLMNRLWQRLDFLIDNRRKFYASRA